MSCEASVIVSGGVPRSRKATTSTRSSTPAQRLAEVDRHQAEEPDGEEREARSSVIESAESSGARRKDSSASRRRSLIVRLVGARLVRAAVEHDARPRAARSCGRWSGATRSRSWVAMTTTVPPALISRSSWKTPRVARSSRLPVGSSARRIGGSLTSARAIATRCCSPPDSSLRVGLGLARRGPPGSAPASPGREWCRAAPRSPRARRRRSPRRCGPPAGGSPGTRCRAAAQPRDVVARAASADR